MNTFGSLKYLEAESNVVEELLFSLKDQLNKLKIEELSIRAIIRRKMTGAQVDETDLTDQAGSSQPERKDSCMQMSSDTQKQSNQLHSATAKRRSFDIGVTQQAATQNKPIEVSINAALELIGRYRERDFISPPVNQSLDPLDAELADLDDTELDETEMNEEPEDDQPTTSAHNDLAFLDLRTCSSDESEEM